MASGAPDAALTVCRRKLTVPRDGKRLGTRPGNGDCAAASDVVRPVRSLPALPGAAHKLLCGLLRVVPVHRVARAFSRAAGSGVCHTKASRCELRSLARAHDVTPLRGNRERRTSALGRTETWERLVASPRMPHCRELCCGAAEAGCAGCMHDYIAELWSNLLISSTAQHYV